MQCGELLSNRHGAASSGQTYVDRTELVKGNRQWDNISMSMCHRLGGQSTMKARLVLSACSTALLLITSANKPWSSSIYTVS